MRFLVLVAVLVVAPAAAEEQGKAPVYEPRNAHAETDTNGDGGVDRAEFHARMVEVFYFSDGDRNGYLSWAELEKAVAFPDDFRGADTDGDGRISLYEFVRVRFDDFDDVDKDHDGLLSVEEIVAVYERGGVR